jgi:hypothetical protein
MARAITLCAPVGSPSNAQPPQQPPQPLKTAGAAGAAGAAGQGIDTAVCDIMFAEYLAVGIEYLRDAMLHLPNTLWMN